jgi:ankyrin repeat protein
MPNARLHRWASTWPPPRPCALPLLPSPSLPTPLPPAPQDGWTPLHVAVREGQLGPLTALLAAGADKERPAGDAARTPLHTAAAAGHGQVVAALLAVGAAREAPAKVRRRERRTWGRGGFQ